MERTWRPWIEGPTKEEMMRRTILLFSMMMVMLLVGSGVALANVFTGTDGSDTYWGPVGNDSITGLGGNDFLVGDPTPYGPGGNDFLSGGDGDDNVSEGPPFDTDTDIAYGGAGDDIMDAFNDRPLMDIIYCGPGDDLVYTDGVDHLLDCETVILGPEPADAWDRLMKLN